MRLRYKPWADEFIKQNQHLILPNAEVYKGQWNAFFNNNHPIHLEIGTGKGQFIAEMSRKYSDINFIGIERAKSVIADAGEKIQDVGATNVVLLNEDASELTHFFATQEIDVIYLNFSDPWPKNRHEKRRLTYHTFLRAYQDILSPRGEIILKTDNQGFFEYSLVSLSQFGFVLTEVNLDLHATADPDNVMTEYEEKFLAKKQRIYRCRAQIK